MGQNQFKIKTLLLTFQLFYLDFQINPSLTFLQVLVICSAMCYSENVLIVRKLIWDAWNISHIARHHVTPDEVETICHENPLTLRGQQKNRLVLIGSTEKERILAVILEAKGSGIYYPITAYPADKKDIALYNRLKNKGGEDNNEKN